MKVTNKTINMIANNRENKTFKAVKKLKSGHFGKPCEYKLYANETPEQGLERLIKNNGVEYKLV